MSDNQERKTKIGRIIIGVATIAVIILLIGLLILKSILEAIIRIAINLPGTQVFLGPNPSPSSILPVLVIFAVIIFSPVLLGIFNGFLEVIFGGSGQPAQSPQQSRQVYSGKEEQDEYTSSGSTSDTDLNTGSTTTTSSTSSNDPEMDDEFQEILDQIDGQIEDGWRR